MKNLKISSKKIGWYTCWKEKSAYLCIRFRERTRVKMTFWELPERWRVSYLVNKQESEKLPPRFERKFFSKKLRKNLVDWKNPPYLCKRFSDETEAEKKRVLWKTLYRQTRKNVVRGVAHCIIYNERNENKKPSIT